MVGISILFGLVTFLLFSIIIDIQSGNQGAAGHIKRYYAHLSGNTKRKKSLIATMLRLTDEQRKYEFNTRKYISYIVPVCTGIFVFILFFFRSWEFALIVSLVGLFYPRWIISGLIEKRRNTLNLQLREAMFTLCSSLRAGASLQTAIERSVGDLERVFHEVRDAPIVYEFRRMAEDIRIGYSLEETLISFRDRVKLEDVDDLVNATLITKKRGGNLTEVMENISRIIGDKIAIKNEIMVMTASKRMESKILSFMPIGIVAFLGLVSPDYMSPMYNTFIGRVLLFVGFVLIGLNFLVSRKIIRINV